MSALLPLSEANLNIDRGPNEFAAEKAQRTSLAQDGDDLASKASSSPFQTEVSAPVDLQRSLRSSKMEDTQKASPNKRAFDFIIHEDATDDSSDPTFRLSPPKRSLKYRTTDELSPRKIPLPNSTGSTQNLCLDNPHTFDFAMPEVPAGKSSRMDSEGENAHLQLDTNDAISVTSDDTRFSAFSVVLNADMTQFANLGTHTPTVRSPGKRRDESQTSTNDMFATPRTSRKARESARTPMQFAQSRGMSGDTTNLLLDFTEQFNAASGKNPRSSTEPNLLSHIKSQRNPSPVKPPYTPGGSSRKLLNLLDFELPPAPTPRSIPTITVRELESMKSTYLSEISSLRASLSGREAEVESLKKAVADAEHRAGQALESAQDEKNAREYAEKEKNDWVKKGREIEDLLQNVREEVIASEKEKEDLSQKLDEANQLREEAEWKAVSATTQANVAQSEVGVPTTETNADVDALVHAKFTAQIDERLEILARELHQVYKEKHENKVTTLKKTYNIRFDKKISELQLRIDELTKSNEELHAAKEASFSDAIPEHVLRMDMDRSAELSKRIETQNSEVEELKAKLAGFMRELESAHEERLHILQELERERVEKGELVAAVDEMLSLQQADASASTPSVVEDFRKSMTRPTALRPASSGLPTPGQSRIGKPPQSRMMCNIAKMGAVRGGEQGGVRE